MGIKAYSLVLAFLLVLRFRGISAQHLHEKRIHLLTILNEATFAQDQQTFARTLNAKNAELKSSLSPLELHSVELAAKPGLAEHLQDLCAAAASSGHAWLAILDLASPASVFSSAMVGQQMALPVLGYVNTLEPEIYRVSDFYRNGHLFSVLRGSG